MICNLCRKRLKERMLHRSSETSTTHHQRLLDLEISTQKDCQICSIVFEKAKKIGITEDFKIVWHSSWDHEYCNFSLLVNFGLGVEEKKECRFELILDSGMKECSTRLPHAVSTASNESWEKALRWFSHCTQNHEQCSSRAQQPAWYPTRLIDLGHPGSIAARLIETNETTDLCGGYTTLSHRWGTSNFIKLTTDSLAVFKNGLPVNQFPKTFAEAMEVTRRLGIRYLWIDSLCIIQEGDNLKDWSHEASLMGKVYMNSICNISATGAINSTKGLFFERNLLRSNPSSSRLPRSSRLPISPGKLGLPILRRKFYIISSNIWEEQVEEAPLNKRAWVVQERFLAPRVLHFGKEQLSWECLQFTASEVFDKGHEGFAEYSLNKRPGKFKGFLYKTSSYETTIQAWHNVLSTYCECSLTNSKDKLVAISGVAKFFQPLLGNDEYIAGLWRKELESELLWEVRDLTTSKRVFPYRAPSFSWASLDACITPNKQDYVKESLINILNISIQTVTDDPTGQVKDGFLHLRGCLKKYWEGAISRIFEDEDFCFDILEPRSKYLYLVSVKVDFFGYCSGLILEAVTKPGLRGCFERVGVFKARSLWLDGLNNSNQSWFEKPQEDETQIPCESYDRISRKHTFILI